VSAPDQPSPFEPLDGEPGPAVPLSPLAARSQAESLVAQTRRGRRSVRLVVLVAVALIATTSAFAAVMIAERGADRVERARSSMKARGDRTAARPSASPPAAVEVPASPSSRDEPSRRDPEPASAHDWLELANAARARRDFVRAEQLYLRVTNRYPGSDDAEAANLSAAELRSQHLGRPRDAIALYRKLIVSHPNAVLAEQARVGLARAYAALGERDAERRAWQELLREHPQSWFSEEARARLRAR
jgi:TolA-binding protein